MPLGSDLSPYANGPFAGTIVSTVLLGGNMALAWLYYRGNTDTWLLRITVTALIAMDIAGTVINAEVLHYTARCKIKHFGDPNILASPIIYYLPMSNAVLKVVTIIIVQIFFINQVYILKRVHRAVAYFILLCATGAFAAGLAFVVYGIRDPTINMSSDRTSMIFTVARCTFAALGDVAVTSALSWSFRVSKTGIKRTDTLLQRLLQYTVTRGALVTAIQICTLIVYVVNPASMDWSALHYCEGKVYVMTMLAMLNSRSTLRDDGNVIMSMAALEFAASRQTDNTRIESSIDQRFHEHSGTDIDGPAYSLATYPKPSSTDDSGQKKAVGILISREQMTVSD
ncbi:hypothetical protein VNI00_003519 [Paramarasmius palmivorus]|uniref:DUF6534 domain-containing protein n=1 Tax=Paramarasmius palmivorus TaxID=297713 RepID=A0AAW0DRB5_9AGAR